jgi:hypothetical protein
VPEWKDFQRFGIFQYVSPERSGSVNLTGSSQPARIQFKSVSPNYFVLLDAKPELGRVFKPDDTTPGFNLEVVISDGLRILVLAYHHQGKAKKWRSTQPGGAWKRAK